MYLGAEAVEGVVGGPLMDSRNEFFFSHAKIRTKATLVADNDVL